MTKKQLKQLVALSYTRKTLDEKKVSHIAKILSKNDLKQYVRTLKEHEKKNTVYVSLPSEPSKQEAAKFNHLYAGKKVVFNLDPSLLLGARLVDGDDVFEYSLNTTFEDFLRHLTTNND